MKFPSIRLLGLVCLTISAMAQETKTITLSISHPGFASGKPEEHELVVKLDAKGNALGYFIDVKSVFCSDEKCDVITLAMEWDAIGRFVGYRLPDGTRLTKFDHEPFTQADYAKFDALMKNRGSALADAEIGQIIVKTKNPAKNIKPGKKPNPKDAASKGDALQKVDAVSGATASYIKEEIVEGAAYTCHTMWHWAHGDTSRQIRAYAQDHGSPAWLTALLGSANTDEIDFALQAMLRRELHDASTHHKLIAAAKAGSMEGYKIFVDHLAQANLENGKRHAAYLELMRAVDGQRRIYLLEKLMQQADAPSLSFFEDFAEQQADWENFYELQLFLSLAEKHNAISDKLLTAVGRVLRHENFFFARRAHAFLRNRKLPQAVQPAFDDYERKSQK